MEAEVHIDFAHSHFRAASAIKWTSTTKLRRIIYRYLFSSFLEW